MLIGQEEKALKARLGDAQSLVAVKAVKSDLDFKHQYS